MKLKFTSILLLLPALLFAKTPQQLHYSRDLGDDVSLGAIATPKKLMLYIDEEPIIKKEKELKREEFLRLCEIAKRFYVESLESEDFTKEDEIPDGDSRLILFSGSSIYALDWKLNPERKNELEALLLQHFELSSVSELQNQKAEPADGGNG